MIEERRVEGLKRYSVTISNLTFYNAGMIAV